MWMSNWSDLEPTLRSFDNLQQRMSALFQEWPFRSVDDLRHRMNALVQDITGDVGRPGLREPGSWLRANLYDTGTELVLCALVPGFTDKNVDITATRERITIAGERKAEVPKGFSVHRQEREPCKFSRSLGLPYAIDTDKIKATVKDGVLTVSMAKSAEAQPRHIDVKAS